MTSLYFRAVQDKMDKPLQLPIVLLQLPVETSRFEFLIYSCCCGFADHSSDPDGSWSTGTSSIISGPSGESIFHHLLLQLESLARRVFQEVLALQVCCSSSRAQKRLSKALLVPCTASGTTPTWRH